jgi:hypothetical protein
MDLAYLHLVLHLLVPALAARLLYPQKWWWAWLIMCLAMIVDVDHLLASPVYDPNRCSINFHPLHCYPAIAIYCLMMIPPRLRIFATGLLLHMGLDAVDCYWM